MKLKPKRCLGIHTKEYVCTLDNQDLFVCTKCGKEFKKNTVETVLPDATMADQQGNIAEIAAV
jgi:hypothetical protein